MPIVNWEHSRNFITKIASYPKIFNMPNSMTYLPEMIPVMIHMSVFEASGTFNVTNPGWIDHNALLQLYKQYVKEDHEYILVETERDLQLLSKRSNNILDTSKLESYCKQYGLKCSPITQAIEEGCKTWC
jgi:3,5-epimerase/4-reductase